MNEVGRLKIPFLGLRLQELLIVLGHVVDKVVVDYVGGQVDCRVAYLGLEFQDISGWWAGRQVDSKPPYLGSGSQNTTNYWILMAKKCVWF